MWYWWGVGRGGREGGRGEGGEREGRGGEEEGRGGGEGGDRGRDRYRDRRRWQMPFPRHISQKVLPCSLGLPPVSGSDGNPIAPNGLVVQTDISVHLPR